MRKNRVGAPRSAPRRAPPALRTALCAYAYVCEGRGKTRHAPLQKTEIFPTPPRRTAAAPPPARPAVGPYVRVRAHPGPVPRPAAPGRRPAPGTRLSPGEARLHRGDLPGHSFREPRPAARAAPGSPGSPDARTRRRTPAAPGPADPARPGSGAAPGAAPVGLPGPPRGRLREGDPQGGSDLCGGL